MTPERLHLIHQIRLYAPYAILWVVGVGAMLAVACDPSDKPGRMSDKIDRRKGQT